MSFAGYGPLGSFGWGTTTAQALDSQARLVLDRYQAAAQRIAKRGDGSAESSSGVGPFPSVLGVRLSSQPNLLNLTSTAEAAVFTAAVFTDNAAENWTEEKRIALHWRKREFSDQPQDVKDGTLQFQQAALASLRRRHAAMEALPLAQQAALVAAAQWLSALVVNVWLRELLLYPLVRDRLDGGADWYTQALQRNDRLRAVLRSIRSAVYLDAADSKWCEQLAEAQQQWEQGWDAELRDWLPRLTDYLQHVQVSTLRDICASHEHVDIPEPSPPTSHELNYGQQLLQMHEMLLANHLKTGNLQGIPRPRHEADWACPDGFQPTHPLTYGPPLDERGSLPASTGLGEQWPQQDPDPQTSTELPPRRPEPTGGAAPYLAFGAGLTRLVKLPDAVSADARARLDAQIEERAQYSRQAHRRAAVQHYGSEQAEALATRRALIASAADKATALNEFLTEQAHTTDLEGSYYYDEVTLAFRNFGTHFETLGEDITPVGEHYLLIHYDVQYWTRVEKWSLKVFGCVERPLTLSLAQVKQLGSAHTWTQPMVMECSGNGRAMMKPRYNKHVPWGLQAFGCYCWTGLPLRLLLQQVGVGADTVDVIFTGYDSGMEHGELRYFQHSIEIHDPVIDQSMLCWMHNGVELLPNHGYPLRLMVPAWYGNANIKWLQSIELVNRKFKGVYQRTYSYSKTPSDNDIACPSQELRPHATLKPMGYPDFTTRTRTALAGKQYWVGKAWVGGGSYRAVMRVEVSLDNGQSWLPCKLHPRLGIFGWHKFDIDIDLAVGLYDVRTRATDNLGNRQTVQLDMWNWASMQDDATQLIKLIVVDGLKHTE